MAQASDANLRQLLATSGQDEAVEVNQRSLIEKILARYSGEFTVFRELLQNADDASAEHVEIHFRSGSISKAGPDGGSHLISHSKDSLPNLKTHNVTSILARNDGLVFREEDWNRLKKIAEGNPDQDKIGAFGVGLYFSFVKLLALEVMTNLLTRMRRKCNNSSLFSLCDEPVVSSGNKLMGFYWKDGKDQLYVKTATNPPGSESPTSNGKPWTSFFMELREPAPMPDPHEFARFLSTCLGFTAQIKTVSFHFDNHLLFRVNKTLAPPRPLKLHPNLASTSPHKILRLESIEEVPLQLHAEVSQWVSFYAPRPKPTALASLSSTAASTTAATSSFASKMLAAFSTSSRSSTPPVPPSQSSSPAPQERPRDPFALDAATLFLRIVSGTIKVSPPKHFSDEMVRATKKNLPSRTTYSLIWTGKDEFDAGRGVGSAVKGMGVEGDNGARGVFAGLMSDLDTNGRVFIGFPTFQTTGNAASVAARFVSTVERESIDFQAPYVATWNRELLWAGGVLARTVYEQEMAEISLHYKGRALDSATKSKLEERALHLMRFFTFSPSTPSAVVGSDTEAAFFTSPNRASITVISQLGPLPANQVRLPNPALAGFLKEVPTIPAIVEAGAPRLLATYRERHLVRDISLDDVFSDLGSHPLSINEAIACFKWWLGLSADRSYTPALLTKLKEAAMLEVVDESTTDVTIFPLVGFRSFVNPSVVPSQLPLPGHTLPFALTKSFAVHDLSRVFGFEELSLVEWVRHLVSTAMVGTQAKAETNLLLSPPFAEKVLAALAKSWSSLTAQRQGEAVAVLAPIAFIPTRQGPRIASEAYFSNVDLFADLPIVTLPSGTPVKAPLEKVLTALGVRRHVELQLVFTRLLGQGDWSHIDLTRYLVSVKDTLSSSELDRLKQTQWLPKEGEAKIPQPPGADGVPRRPKVVRYSAKQLFEPTETLRALGLPLLDWTSAPQKWRPGSDEARFLFDVGLLRTPPVDQILQIAATPGNAALQDKALRYFLDEYSNAGYGSSYSPVKHPFAFVPAVQNGAAILAKPNEVYSNPAVALLGFPVIASRVLQEAGRLKITSDPAPALLVNALVKSPPANVAKAQRLFAYLSSQISQFSSTQIATLRTASIVPIELSPGGAVEMRTPGVCFFSTDPSLPPGLKTLFTILSDFGLAAKPFLTAVGVKESPSTAEIASMVVADPGRMLDLSGSAERYLTVLRTLAVNYKSLPLSLQKQMRSSPFFLGTKRAPSAPSPLLDNEDEDDDDASGTLVYELAPASSLVVNDEPHNFRAFESEILACPQEETIEDLAIALGASRISRLVTSLYQTNGAADEESKRAVDLRRAVSERAVLFLSERQQQHGKSELKYEPDWIQKHLRVFEVQSIEHVLTLSFNRATRRVTQQASAYVRMAPDGRELQLYVAPEDLDFYYEAASGLCKQLLVRQRPNDVLLLMTVLQTSLKNLKRRGYNVDRILNARQAARDAAEKRLQEERRQAQLQQTNTLPLGKLELAVEQLAQLFPDADTAFLRSVLQSQQPPHVQNAANAMLSMDYPRKAAADAKPPNELTSTASGGTATKPPLPSLDSNIRKDGYDNGLFSQFKKKLRPESKAGSGTSAVGDALSRLKSPPPMPPNRPTNGSTTTAGPSPTSTDAIRSNVLKAVQAARPEASDNIVNEVSKTQVRESESYCDATHAANLAFVQDIGGIKMYADRALPDPQAFVRENFDKLQRFITLVLVPVGQVFDLNPRSLHVFHDLEGPLIAFNRGGAIYFNSRYYFAWHDHQVLAGHRHDALISAYHSLAHELAHNLVQPHDAQHSFYFSSLCEMYFLRMAQLLARTPN